ncbi:hypothetical protein ACFX13_030467 [Malus domestica]
MNKQLTPRTPAKIKDNNEYATYFGGESKAMGGRIARMRIWTPESGPAREPADKIWAIVLRFDDGWNFPVRFALDHFISEVFFELLLQPSSSTDDSRLRAFHGGREKW